MSRNKALFLAFPGTENEQLEAAFDIGHGYQCWNLRKLSRDEFIAALKHAIPPVTDNVLTNYAAELSGDPRYGIDDQTYEQCGWGLLIPSAPHEGGMFGVAESLFLLELYAPMFPPLVFSASDFGIIREPSDRPSVYLRQAPPDIFRRREFVAFFEMLAPQSQYATWYVPRLKSWNSEDWRLFAAALLFRGLRDYQDGKNFFGWQRESADMTCVLEALFTANDKQRNQISVRLRKRVAALLSHKFPEIEQDIKALYQQRSDFVHGSFFAQMAKDSKASHSGLPTPNFFFLEAQRERVRWALAAYLRLAQLLSADPARYNGKGKALDVLEAAIADGALRTRMRDDLESLFLLLRRHTSLQTSSTAKTP